VLAGFGVVRSAHGFALLLFVMGGLQTACVASINTMIQLVVHDGMRGRVMSMMTVILFGFALSRHLKTGHSSTGQNRPTRSGASRRVCDYRIGSSGGKTRLVVRIAAAEESAWVCA
jgi:hypothetical protein